jgi:bifunctional non-homologous end joining protein LigD
VALGADSGVIDSEGVWCAGAGLAVFDKLHGRTYDEQISLYAFDLLELDGEDWRPRRLEERKAKLQRLLAKVRPGVQFNEHIDGDGAAVFAHACKLGCEGIVSKHRGHLYRSGPTKSWLKIKNPSALIRHRSRFFDGFGMGAISTFGSSTFTSMMAGRPLSEM